MRRAARLLLRLPSRRPAGVLEDQFDRAALTDAHSTRGDRAAAQVRPNPSVGLSYSFDSLR
jgi:hypothetical protein